MTLLDKEDWILIESEDKQSVYAGIYEHEGARAYETFNLFDLPNDLIRREDFESYLINWSDWKAGVRFVFG